MGLRRSPTPDPDASIIDAIRHELVEQRSVQDRLLAALERTNGLLAALERTNRLLVDIRRIGEGVQMALTQRDMAGLDAFYRAHVLGLEETLQRLADRQISFARFGDGEFRAVLHPDYDLRLQQGSPELAAALRRVLVLHGYDPDRLMLGFPLPYRSPHWQRVWSGVWPQLAEILPRHVTWGCTHATRPIAFRRLGPRGVELWRRVWDGRDIAVITGKGSRFSLHPHLFDNVASLEFIYSESRDAFSDLERVLGEVTAPTWDGYGPFLISLGPAGTVLAAELSRAGRWAIDIGHLSASYEHVAEGAVSPEHRRGGEQ
jgi:hypothetical protein